MRNLLTNHKNQLFLVLIVLAVISIGYFIFRSGSFIPSVKSTLPASGQFLNTNSAVQIEFNQELSPAEQKNVNIVTTPNFKFHLVWDTPSLLSIIPEDLAPTDSLVVSILYKDKNIYDLSLIAVTSPYNSPELNRQAQQQAADDLIFSQKIKDAYDKYPFLSQLPISTPDYVIVFETDISDIRVRIIGTDETAIRAAALAKIKEIGVDTTKFPVRFVK